MVRQLQVYLMFDPHSHDRWRLCLTGLCLPIKKGKSSRSIFAISNVTMVIHMESIISYNVEIFVFTITIKGNSLIEEISGNVQSGGNKYFSSGRIPSQSSQFGMCFRGNEQNSVTGSSTSSSPVSFQVYHARIAYICCYQYFSSHRI